MNVEKEGLSSMSPGTKFSLPLRKSHSIGCFASNSLEQECFEPGSVGCHSTQRRWGGERRQTIQEANKQEEIGGLLSLLSDTVSVDKRKPRVWNLLDKNPDILQVANMSIILFVASVLYTLSIQHFSKTIPYIMQTPKAMFVLPFPQLLKGKAASVALDRQRLRLQFEKLNVQGLWHSQFCLEKDTNLAFGKHLLSIKLTEP